MRCHCLVTLLLAASLSLAIADEPAWTDLLKDGTLDAFQTPVGEWVLADSAASDAKDPKKLTFQPGRRCLVNGERGRTRDLLTKALFGDVELHVEFLIPKGSNSGVKFHGLYEIQIADSHGKKEVTASDSGGIYPRAEMLPTYRHIDKGIPPQANAAKPADEWQTLEAIFQAPKFDSDGNKTANARLVKVVLNGTVIHENVELATPTGHNWKRKEIATGPLLLQGDHGPVAFRNLRVRTKP